ncbi:hypothetical protein VB264_10685 [Arcicella aquatica]|uniref:Glycine zipper family protein n=1 Tax=Arcicella aquatica TaxID=217141 RepID=A0ABU5QPC4_9BACT|nr:hypothetical protein [Arcicella aquatica]MEA5258246.1 hypothetical protein [Arcicella aquatica]
MKNTFLLLLFALSTCTSFCQDIITYTNGKTQNVKVLTTTDTHITCEDYVSKDRFTIAKTLILSIKYQEGKTEPLGIVLPQKVTTTINENQKVLDSQDSVYFKGGGIIYKGIHYKKIDEMDNILLKTSNPQITNNLVSYRSKSKFANTVASVGSFIMGWSIGAAIGGKGFNTGLFGIGTGIVGIGLIINSSANKQLKQAIATYNSGLVLDKKVSLTPIFYQNNYKQMNIGIALNF